MSGDGKKMASSWMGSSMKKIHIDKKVLIEEYVNNKLSCLELSRKLNISPWTIRTRLKDYNIPIRGYSEAFKLREITWGDKISKGLKGRKCTWKDKLSNSNKGHPSHKRKRKHEIQRHHIDLNHANTEKSNILLLTGSKHSSLHSRAYNYLVETGQVEEYIKWFDDNVGLTGE